MPPAELAAAIASAVANRGGLTGHFASCETKLGAGRPCTCGWARILTMIAKSKKVKKL